MPTPKNTKARNQAAFQRERTRILADNPPCDICGRDADTIDHIRPVDTFTNPTDANNPDNLRPLCRSCNSRQGARYGNAKQAGRIPEPTTESDHQFLDRSRFLPPHDSDSVSEPIVARVSPDSPGNTEQVPRLRTITEGGDRSRLGMLEETTQRVLGRSLLPWQRLVLGDQLSLEERDGEIRPMFRQSVVSVARQNGKTWAIQSLLLHWLLNEPKLRGTKQTVITTAHRLDLASELFKELAPHLEALGAECSWSYGRQSLELQPSKDFPGARWLVRAATPSAGHGLSADLVIVDELFGCSPESIEDALIPTMRARRDPLLSCWSTAGEVDESVVFRRMRERGIAEIDTGRRTRLYYAEFSPPSDLDPMSPAAWAYANPGLGHTIEMETIEEESRSPNRAAFLRASVNLWVAGHRSWLDPGLFASLGTATDLPVDGGVLAVEASTDDQRFVGVRAVEDGNKVKVTVEFIVDSLADLWQAVTDSAAAHKGMQIAVGAALDVHLPPKLKDRAVLVGMREIQKWTTIVRSMTMAGQVIHTNEELLVTQVERAVLVKHQGHPTLSTARSPGPIELCRAYVWAVAQAGKPRYEKRVAAAFAD